MVMTKTGLMKKYPRFFDVATMKFFGSRLEACGFDLGDGVDLFITSEEDPHGVAWDGERRFTVRVAWLADDGREVHFDVGSFGKHGAMREAFDAAKQTMANWERQKGLLSRENIKDLT
jgi:hypothetical protein